MVFLNSLIDVASRVMEHKARVAARRAENTAITLGLKAAAFGLFCGTLVLLMVALYVALQTVMAPALALVVIAALAAMMGGLCLLGASLVKRSSQEEEG